MLPRHYWNFPTQYNHNGSLVPHVKSTEFIEKYKKVVYNHIYRKKTSNVNLEIVRVLFVAKDDSVKSFEDTVLYNKAEMEKDFKYYCAKKVTSSHLEYVDKMQWKEFVNSVCKKGESDLYLMDLKIDNDFISEISNSYIGNDELYIMQQIKKQKGYLSVGDYYIKYLHTNPKENARHIIITNDDDSTDADNGCYRIKDVPSLSPNLSYIDIKFEEDDTNWAFILDTYMDIRRGFVKLQIQDANIEKNRDLYYKIQHIRKMSKPIKGTDVDNFSYSKKKESVLTKIKIYANGNTANDEDLQKVKHIEKNISKLSRNDLLYFYKKLSTTIIKDIITELYEKIINQLTESKYIKHYNTTSIVLLAVFANSMSQLHIDFAQYIDWPCLIKQVTLLGAVICFQKFYFILDENYRKAEKDFYDSEESIQITTSIEKMYKNRIPQKKIVKCLLISIVLILLYFFLLPTSNQICN